MAGSSEQSTVLREWIVVSENELDRWAEEFSRMSSFCGTVLLDGPMGSGKTTIVSHLMKTLGGEEASSPTFSLVNEYRYPGGTVYHFDLYRIDKLEDLEEIGFEEYLEKDAICLIEWSKLGMSYYDQNWTNTLCIEILSGERRRIQWIKGIAL